MLSSSKSATRARPRDPDDSVLGRLVTTVVEGAGVAGQSFQTREFIIGAIGVADFKRRNVSKIRNLIVTSWKRQTSSACFET